MHLRSGALHGGRREPDDAAYRGTRSRASPTPRCPLHPFATDDGLGLSLTRFHRADCDDVVLLVHGLTSSSDMFIMPEHRNLATFLLDNGFTDVWTLDFRMSNRFPYDTETHRYTLDDIADYDHPAALRELRRHIGDRRVHVIAHCLGSMSFTMSLFGGRLPRHRERDLQQRRAHPAGAAMVTVEAEVRAADPRSTSSASRSWTRVRRSPPLTRGWVLARLVAWSTASATYSACHLLSFMWGSGQPAMYEHDNLLPVTHERMADLCGACGMHYYRHLRQDRPGRARGEIRPGDPHRDLPDDYLAERRGRHHADPAPDRRPQPRLHQLQHRLPPAAVEDRAWPVRA